MNTAKQNLTTEDPIFIFKIITGGRYYSGDRNKLSEDLWHICHSVFWFDETFTESEVTHFKKLIASHFEGHDDTEAYFMQLVERVLMARQYINRRPWRYIAKPKEWLNVHFDSGLARTAQWYKNLLHERSLNPAYRKELKLVAEALLDYSNSQDADAVRAYMLVLTEYKCFDLLRLYVNAILQLKNPSK